ncbi:hypothetical protein PMAYCL1PPCAC_14533, partial [Pristionchus mayeri]
RRGKSGGRESTSRIARLSSTRELKGKERRPRMMYKPAPLSTLFSIRTTSFSSSTRNKPTPSPSTTLTSGCVLLCRTAVSSQWRSGHKRGAFSRRRCKLRGCVEVAGYDVFS